MCKHNGSMDSMELEQNIAHGCTQVDPDVKTIEHKHESLVPVLADSETTNDCFNCSICFESAYEPVVTLCGHLFCWACIFKWLRLRSTEPAQTCPVCKANISESLLVPLYGRGGSRDDSGSGITNLDLSIPPRPTTTALQISSHPDSQLLPHHLVYHSSILHHQHFHDPHGRLIEFSSPSNVAATVMAGLISPSLEILSELVRKRIWGSSYTELFAYGSSYSSMMGTNGGGSHPRIRRQEMQLDKSLGRRALILLLKMNKAAKKHAFLEQEIACAVDLFVSFASVESLM
ncbi:E3 ubiquitin-protein ligase RMA1-like protein [Drosera capensis]